MDTKIEAIKFLQENKLFFLTYLSKKNEKIFRKLSMESKDQVAIDAIIDEALPGQNIGNFFPTQWVYFKDEASLEGLFEKNNHSLTSIAKLKSNQELLQIIRQWNETKSYCQIWCMPKISSGGLPV